MASSRRCPHLGYVTVPLLHFVGFRDDRYWNAVRVFGPPDMLHRDYDVYAANDIAPGDMVVFARGPADQSPRSFSVEAQASRAGRNRNRIMPLEQRQLFKSGE